MNKTAQTFFRQLALLEHTPQVLAAFTRYIDRPLPSPAFFDTLFCRLADYLLRKLKLPATPGAAQREWQPLYRMGSTIDPYYHSPAQLREDLGQCPAMPEAQLRRFSAVLDGYFRLRREGFPANLPSPWLTAADAQRWTALFPANWAWDALEVLQEAGLYPVGRKAAARTWARYGKGLFEPEWERQELECWQALCSGKPEPEPEPELESEQDADPAFAQRRDFMAAAFGGDFPSLGLEAWCGEVPRCGSCTLATECRWAARSTRESREEGAILGRVHQGRIAHLSNAQLLRTVLGCEPPEHLGLDNRIAGISLRRLAGEAQQDLEPWLESAGIPAERLECLFELGRRFGEERLQAGVLLGSGREVFNHYWMRLRDYKQEQFLVVLLDSRRRFLAEVMVSQGTLNTSPVHPREVFNPAVRQSAAGIIIAHNHPSGDPSPSKDDINITMQLVQAGKVLGIPLLDHVIIAGDEYISFAEADLL